MHSNHVRVEHKIVFNISFIFFSFSLCSSPSERFRCSLGVCVAHSAHNTRRYPYFLHVNFFHGSQPAKLTLFSEHQVSLNFHWCDARKKRRKNDIMISRHQRKKSRSHFLLAQHRSDAVHQKEEPSSSTRLRNELMNHLDWSEKKSQCSRSLYN